MDRALPYDLLTLRFRDAALEAAFLQEQGERAARPMRWVSLGLLVIITLVIAVTLLVLPEREDWIARLSGPMLATLAFGFATTWLPAYGRRYQPITMSVLAFAALANVNIVVLYPQDRLAVAFFLPMLCVLMTYALFGLRFPRALVLGWSLAACHVLAMHWAHGMTGVMLFRQGFAMILTNLVGMMIGWRLESSARLVFVALREAERERRRADAVLANVLPAAIAEQLKRAPGTIAEAHPSVTVLFADIVGFTSWCAQRPPDVVVQVLDRIFTAFDGLAARHGLEKIKTVGDCYMAAAGLPAPRRDHAMAALAMAQDMLAEAARLSELTGEPVRLRVGLSSGPVVAGVIGRTKFLFDLWGDTVNTASRMESHGEPGRIQCSEATARLLPDVPLEPRGTVDVRGKGPMPVFLVA